MKNITERYKKQINGVISCYDRIVLSGTLPKICYSKGMSDILYGRKIQIFDYEKFAVKYRDIIKFNAYEVSESNGIPIEYISEKWNECRKDEMVEKKIKEHHITEGLVCIFSALEIGSAYRPKYSSKKKIPYLQGRKSKYLHYYFYFIDKDLGLCYLRVPTWLPCRMQFYCNGHNILMNKLKKNKIDFKMLDNSFVKIDDFEKAQQLSDSLDIEFLSDKLQYYTEQFNPLQKIFWSYTWSIMQLEYSTDVVFRSQQFLQSIYEELISTAIHTVKAKNIATFLSRKLYGSYEGEVGNNYNIRLEGTCIKHSMGKSSIKMYDKFKQILRIETTSNNVSFFKAFRTVQHRDGSLEKKYATVRKNIYSLRVLKDIMFGCNRRYLEYISAIEDRHLENKILSKITEPVVYNKRKYKGFNFFDKLDCRILKVFADGKFNIYGFRNADIRYCLKNKNTGYVSRILKRMFLHGIIKKVRNSYKYYLTKIGKQIIYTALKIKELYIIPHLNYINN